MENIIEKLKLIKDKNVFDDWTLDEMCQLLDLYLIICKKENHIFDLIYGNHGCDSWEDIFRDYDIKYLEDKAVGVEIAIDGITEQINKERQSSRG